MKKINFNKSMVKSKRGLSNKAKVVAVGVGLTVGAAGLQSCDPEDVTPPTPTDDTSATYDSNSFDTGATYDSD